VGTPGSLLPEAVDAPGNLGTFSEITFDNGDGQFWLFKHIPAGMTDWNEQAIRVRHRVAANGAFPGPDGVRITLQVYDPVNIITVAGQQVRTFTGAGGETFYVWLTVTRTILGGAAQPFSGGQMLRLRVIVEPTTPGAGFMNVRIGEIQANWI
jgi:hypothetical protein